MSSLDLSGQTILITGGAGAIGYVVTERLIKHGARVIVNDIVADPTLPDGAGYVRGSSSTDDEAQQVLEHAPEFDAVCLHAGVVAAHPVDRYPTEAFDHVMEVNLRSAFLLARAAAARWRSEGRPGHLVFTTSWVQDVPWPEIAPYSASKAALKSLMRGFARELAPYGIRANAIAPGIVGVGMAKRQWDNEPEYRARASRAIPLGHLQTPESVADAFAFLLSPMASYMTGSVLLVDGGASLYPMD